MSMEISEHELRTMIREAISRATGAGAHAQRPAAAGGASDVRLHASHLQFSAVPSGGGECIIEPAVPCNHCGYCKSMGH
jgi:hypothetical protein